MQTYVSVSSYNYVVVLTLVYFLPPPFLQSSQCFSGPNSINHDLTSISLRDLVSSQPPMLRSALHEGYRECNQEQMEQLRAEINAIKASYRSKNGVWKKFISINSIVLIKLFFIDPL